LNSKAFISFVGLNLSQIPPKVNKQMPVFHSFARRKSRDATNPNPFTRPAMPIFQLREKNRRTPRAKSMPAKGLLEGRAPELSRHLGLVISIGRRKRGRLPNAESRPPGAAGDNGKNHV
jgi:hypothetical protein